MQARRTQINKTVEARYALEFKQEAVRLVTRGQRFVTRRDAKDEVMAWLPWYNQTRLHSTLAHVSPMQFEQDWLAERAKQVNS